MKEDILLGGNASETVLWWVHWDQPRSREESGSREGGREGTRELAGQEGSAPWAVKSTGCRVRSPEVRPHPSVLHSGFWQIARPLGAVIADS